MRQAPARISLSQWDSRYRELLAAGLREPSYGGPLQRHLADGDSRLSKLQFDNSPAALRLWNFLLSEGARLRQARERGVKIVGVMKDLGTAAVIAHSAANVTAFYPDGAWWIPCVMECSDQLLAAADSLGLDESFCPVRAMIGVFYQQSAPSVKASAKLAREHFPIPDLLTCAVGATCDDFSAIAQRLEHMGQRILWWELPHRRLPDRGEDAVTLPGGFRAPAAQVAFVRAQLETVAAAIGKLAGKPLSNASLAAGIAKASRVRRVLAELRELAFTAPRSPMPALEMLIAEMLAIHFCSDPDETIAVLEELTGEVRRRVREGVGVLDERATKVFWVNPVADLRVMNLLEDCGGRVCGTEYLFCHALDEIPQGLPPMEALARMALADPMAGPTADRAERICRDIRRFGASAVVISRIPGASHCAIEGRLIGDIIASQTGLPVAEIEVPPLSDSLRPAIRTRLEALLESAAARR